MKFSLHMSKALQETEGVTDTDGKSFYELVSDFFQLINGNEPDEADWKILEEVAKEAGVIE